MEITDVDLLKGLVAKTNALEKIMLESEFKEKYVKYLGEWNNAIDKELEKIKLEDSVKQKVDKI